MLEYTFPGVDVIYQKDGGQEGMGVVLRRGRWNT